MLLLILNSFAFATHSQTDSTKDCYPIQYLDFFGLDQIDVVKWPESELVGMLNMDFTQTYEAAGIKTNFVVPMIVYQLKDYHPRCNSNVDRTYFNQLALIYCKIREMDPSILQSKTHEEQVDFIRDDYYHQVANDQYLPYMEFNMDDGPFYGIDLVQADSLEEVSCQITAFGELCIFKRAEKMILVCYDLQKKVMWQKIITREPDRYLGDLNFTEQPLHKTSLATVIKMYAEGERFTLYLKNNGAFMYYFHSW